jgi:hypothetical protein
MGVLTHAETPLDMATKCFFLYNHKLAKNHGDLSHSTDEQWNLGMHVSY